jgi:hypothetical protein
MNSDKYPIDLGKPMNSGGPISTEPQEAKKKEKYYPSLYLDWEDDYELPESGVMEVRFKKRSETNRSQDGKTTQSVEIEIREILEVTPDKKAKSESESGEKALDRYRDEAGK